MEEVKYKKEAMSTKETATEFKKRRKEHEENEEIKKEINVK